METTERVARAICAKHYFEQVPTDYWKTYLKDAQAAIDAMQQDIAEADRKAREECAAICASLAERPYDGEPESRTLVDVETTALLAAEAAIRDTITPASRQDDAQSAE
jgi:cytochrome P450